jgi:hypothetical protein
MIGHAIINPYGEVIRISQRTFDVLHMKGYLHKDRRTGMKGMDPKHADMFIATEKGRPWERELGSDFQGPNVVVCGCGRCRKEMGIAASDPADQHPDQIPECSKGKEPIASSQINEAIKDTSSQICEVIKGEASECFAPNIRSTQRTSQRQDS